LIIIINIILRVDADGRRDRRAADTTDGDVVARPMVDICLSSSSRRRRAVVDPSVVDSTGVAH
jgi:hypothetical protein